MLVKSRYTSLALHFPAFFISVPSISNDLISFFSFLLFVLQFVRKKREKFASMSNLIRLVVNNYNEILAVNKGNRLNIVKEEALSFKRDVHGFVFSILRI